MSSSAQINQHSSNKAIEPNEFRATGEFVSCCSNQKNMGFFLIIFGNLTMSPSQILFQNCLVTSLLKQRLLCIEACCYLPCTGLSQRGWQQRCLPLSRGEVCPQAFQVPVKENRGARAAGFHTAFLITQS